MASEVSIKVKATNEASPAIKAAERDLKSLEGAAEDIRGTLKGFDQQSGVVRETLSKLDGQILKNKQSLRDLATSFADARTEAEKLDLGGKIKDIERDLGEQLKVRKIKLDELIEIDTARKLTLKDLVDVERDIDSARSAGRSWVSKFASGIEGAAGSALAPAGKFIGESMGAKAGLAAAQALIPVLGGALSAGAGTIGLGAGIALAIKSDTELQSAGKELGNQIFGGLTQRAHTAFYEPIKGTLDDLGDYGTRIVDDWGDAFENLAPHLRPFVDQVAETVTDLSGVIANIAGNSGPALDALADGFSELGDAAGDLLTSLTADAEGNASALRIMFGAVSDVIGVLSTFIDIQREARDVTGDFFVVMGPLGQVITQLGQAYADAQGPNQEFRAVTKETAEAAAEASGQLNAERNALEGLSEALKAQSDPAYAMIAAQQDLKEAQEKYSSAVKKSGKNSDAAKDALIDLSKAAIEVAGAAEKTGGTFDGSITPSLRAAFKAAGLTEKQIDGVASAFRGAKKAGDAFEGKYTASVQQRGAEAARRAIASAASAARAYAGQYVAALSVKINRIDAGFNAGPQLDKATGGVIGTAAHGATSSGMTLVGENGPELITAPAGTRVWSAADTFRARRTIGNLGIGAPGGHFNDYPSGPMGGGTFSITLNVDGRAVAVQMIDPIRELTNTRAGGNVQNLFGGN